MPLFHLQCDRNRIETLEPLRGAPLMELGCTDNRIESLSPLAGMSLRYLLCQSNRIASLAPIKGMPLTRLNCNQNQIKSLEPLRGMPLVWLSVTGNPMTDLEPLRGMPLRHFDCSYTRVRDLRPLGGLEIDSLWCAGNPLNSLGPFLERPPKAGFVFDSDSLPDADYEKAIRVWSAKEEWKPFARDARILLALRRCDWPALKALAVRAGGHAYLSIPRRCSWPEARKLAREMGGHLATITSPAEQDSVHKATGNRQAAWIGLELADGAFRWCTGEPVHFTHFAVFSRGQAGNGYGLLHRSGFWGCGLRGGRFPFVVEWDEP
jgi:hypothetical protein